MRARPSLSLRNILRLIAFSRCCILPTFALWLSAPTTDAPSTSNPTPEVTTSSPTKAPSERPSFDPTDIPSQEPTSRPTLRGTQEPTEKEIPTTTPPASPPTLPPTNPTTSAPTKPPTAPPTPTPTSAPTTPTQDDVLYTIIVMSDVENKYRGHNIDRSRFVVQYIRDINTLDLFFDGDYNQHKIDPQLVINNGDVSHFWACHNPNYLDFFIGDGCRTPLQEFDDIWGQLYTAGIPMISSYGNHDWRPRIGTGNLYRGPPQKPRDQETDTINRWSSEFVRMTYNKAVTLGGLLDVQVIPPVGEIGQDMFRSTFRGLQIASFNSAYNWQSYDDGGVYPADDQFDRLAATLNRTQPTLFFSHFPLSSTRLGNQTPTNDTVIKLIQEFPPGTHHFAGHYHAAVIEPYEGFNDYVVPYPHTWNGREPGYLAVLVSQQKGVVQVKAMTIPGLEDGTICTMPGEPNLMTILRDYIAPSDGVLWRPWRKHFDNFLGRGSDEDRDESSQEEEEAQELPGCERCKAGRQYWSTTNLAWVCGELHSGENSIVNDNQDETDIYDSLDGIDFDDQEE